MAQGLDDAQRQEMGVHSADAFRYLCQGGVQTVPGMSDAGTLYRSTAPRPPACLPPTAVVG
jgi:hypothetical protein